MDSPLLPQMRKHAAGTTFDDQSNLLGDLSINDSQPSTSSSSNHAPAYLSASQATVTAGPSRSQPSSSSYHPPPAAEPRAKPKKRFSLFAQPALQARPVHGVSGANALAVEEEEEQEDEDEDDHGKRGGSDGEEEDGDLTTSTDHSDPDQTVMGVATKVKVPSAGLGTSGRQGEDSPALSRDDKLRSSLFELRKMNEVFSGFLTGLEDAKEHNERLAVRTKHTSTLLDHYIELMGQAEHTQRLILNPAWQGGLDDLTHLQKQMEAEALAIEAERKRLEEEARRKEEESKAVRERAERDRLMREGGLTASRGGFRGRGSVRGAPGVRGGAPRGRVPSGGLSRLGSSTAPSTGTRGTGLRQPSGSSLTRGSGIPRR